MKQTTRLLSQVHMNQDPADTKALTGCWEWWEGMSVPCHVQTTLRPQSNKNAIKEREDDFQGKNNASLPLMLLRESAIDCI